MNAAPGSRLFAAALIVLLGLVSGEPAPRAARPGAQKSSTATLTLRASPSVGFAPVRIYLTGEVKGGPDDNEKLYCPAVVWDWGDDTTSESQADCEPYEPAKSRIQRFYSVEHLFKVGGVYRVRLQLQQRKRPVLSASIELVVGDAGGAAPPERNRASVAAAAPESGSPDGRYVSPVPFSERSGPVGGGGGGGP